MVVVIYIKPNQIVSLLPGLEQNCVKAPRGCRICQSPHKLFLLRSKSSIRMQVRICLMPGLCSPLDEVGKLVPIPLTPTAPHPGVGTEPFPVPNTPVLPIPRTRDEPSSPIAPVLLISGSLSIQQT